MVATAVVVCRGSYDLTPASAQSHVSQAWLLLRLGLTERAIEEAQTAVVLVPDSAALGTLLGETLKKHIEIRKPTRLSRKQS